MVDRMRSYVKSILNGNVELTLTPLTMAKKLEYQQLFKELEMERPDENDFYGLQHFYEGQTCAMFFTVCEDVEILGDLDIPDLDMLNEFWQASQKVKDIKTRFELWLDHITTEVSADLHDAVVKPDKRLQAPPALQSTEKKQSVPSL